MSEPTVDLGQIRGDWDFHARYVTNAMEQTLKRLHKTWRSLKAKQLAAGIVPMDGALMDEFLEACRQTRAITDDILLMRDTQPVKKGKARPKGPAKRKARSKK
jgi:hypothetical protein